MAPSTPSPSPSPPHPIHGLHRLFFLYLEPLLIVGGILQVLLVPLDYIAASHPLLHAHLTSSPSLGAALQQSGVFTVVAGGWAIMAFNDAVTLRAFVREPRVWWYVLAAHLCSDVLYVAALARDVGGWGRAVSVGEWTGMEWLTNVLTVPGVLAKVAVLVGWGVEYGAVDGRAGGKVRRE